MRRGPIITLLIPAVAASVALGACGGDDDSAGKSATTTKAAASTAPGGSTTSASTTGDGSTTSTAVTTTTAPGATTTTSADAGLGLEDGRHPVYITAVDVPGRALTFDVIQFLTGQDAIDAYHADHPDDPEGPPNDFYIVNANPRLRTAGIAPDATVMLVRLSEDSSADLDPGTFEELPAYLAATPPSEGPALSASPFWLTVEGGVVTAIEEQYLP